MHIPWVKITDEPEVAYEDIAERLGITVDEAVACPKILFGSSSEVVNKLREIREDTDINYFSFGLNNADLIIKFAKSVIGPLRT